MSENTKLALVGAATVVVVVGGNILFAAIADVPIKSALIGAALILGALAGFGMLISRKKRLNGTLASFKKWYLKQPEPLTQSEIHDIEEIAERIIFETTSSTHGLDTFKPEVRHIILKTAEEWKNRGR